MISVIASLCLRNESCFSIVSGKISIDSSVLGRINLGISMVFGLICPYID